MTAQVPFKGWSFITQLIIRREEPQERSGSTGSIEFYINCVLCFGCLCSECGIGMCAHFILHASGGDGNAGDLKVEAIVLMKMDCNDKMTNVLILG